MTTTFKNASANTPTITLTENGMETYATSLNDCVDLFFTAGALRGGDIIPLFERAWQEDRVIASKLALWLRDIRGGAGERKLYRDILNYIEVANPEFIDTFLDATPEIGRWDDLLVLKTDKAKAHAFELIQSALQAGDGLCAKWMPRKGDKAVELRKFLHWTPKQYRKTLVNLTNVVETKMCAKDWDNIDFNRVPSLASARYQSAFKRNAPVKYAKYNAALAKNDGSAKVNAGAVYPYDVLKPLIQSNGYNHWSRANASENENTEVIKAQWEALPNYIGDDLILPMVDVSGSMYVGAGGSGTLTAMDVAVSLGLYLADKNTGPYKDMFLTFSASPKIEVLGGDIIAKVSQMMDSNWGMSTNLEAAFTQILQVATKNKVAEEDMPKYLLILSDMQFDRCVKFGNHAFTMIQKQYEKAGYELPKIVFWNIAARTGQSPVTFDQNGTALVSGFSPAIMKSILAAKNFNPQSIMLEALSDPRYNVFS